MAGLEVGQELGQLALATGEVLGAGLALQGDGSGQAVEVYLAYLGTIAPDADLSVARVPQAQPGAG